MKTSTNTWRWITRAVTEANKSTEKYRLGAVVTLGGAFLASGHNKTINNPDYIDPKHCGTCAERNALKKVSENRRKGTVVYVARINKHGLALARPCERCQGYMEGTGVSRVYFTVDNDTVGMLRFR